MIKRQGKHKQKCVGEDEGEKEKSIVEPWREWLSQITVMRWAPWACVSAITPCLSISQWLTSPLISVSVKSAHHMLTTLPFTSAHTQEDGISTQHLQVWCEWHGCCGCCVEHLVDVLPLLWCGRMMMVHHQHLLTKWAHTQTDDQSGSEWWVHHGMEWHDWCITIIQHTGQRWSWRVVWCASTPTQPPSQATCVDCEPLPCPSSHWVVDVLSQFICVLMIHHCDTLLNATQCGHVCHHLSCEPKGMVWPHHHLCTITPFLVHTHKAWCCECVVWSHNVFCIHSLCGVVNHHTMIGSWWLWFIIISMPMHSNSVVMCGLWCQCWCPWLCGSHGGHAWVCSFLFSFTPGHQWLWVMCASVRSTPKLHLDSGC